MTLRQDLHQPVDQLTDEEATEALEYLRLLVAERERRVGTRRGRRRGNLALRPAPERRLRG